MQHVGASSHQLSDLMGVIDCTPLCTNIRALKAGVEAAGASEGGRGFAVAPGEVRSLAQRSAQAVAVFRLNRQPPGVVV